MSRNILDKDFRTTGYILKRTNYGEADRILNVITPRGKISVIAKGARKEKSKLAGGIEMFSLVELGVHRGRGEMGLITSARMKEYYGNLLKDLARVELSALILRKVSAAAESSDNPDFFDIVDQTLSGLNAGLSSSLIESWFWLNLAKASGEEINLHRDVDGVKLSPENRYSYNISEKALFVALDGELGAEEIKMMRLMLATKVAIVARVKNLDLILPKVLGLARIMSGAV
ncbi:DNA repair protein RecO [Candidatus Saccharibacteria bacterium]|nr:DNA repair protein RecO [Candidatus Saccharibacteria bacterium]